MRGSKSPSATEALIEPRLDLGNLGELLRSELALQSFDSLGEVLRVFAALDSIVGKALRVRERLRLGACIACLGRRLPPWLPALRGCSAF